MGALAPPQPSTSATSGGAGGGGYRSQDAEMLFRTKPISEIRKVEAATRKEIDDKSEELRQLVGNRYRDLIDSADYIMQMKSTCESISGNISAIHDSLVNTLSSSIDSPRSFSSNPDSSRARIYAIACRVKYLVDTPENIWGCLDESMFLESSARYFRAKHVHRKLLDMNKAGGDDSFTMYNSVRSSNVLSNFPLLQHQWQIVESFKAQISQRSRERLLDQGILGLGIGAYADALAAVAVIDELDPKQVLTLFLDSRKSCITKRLSSCSSNANANSEDVITVFCDVLKIIQVSIAQVGELFLQALTDLPLFYKTILGSPPASQLFGGIPNPDGEIRLWTSFKDKLESTMVMLDRDFIAKTCSDWLRNCGKEIVNDVDGRYLIDVICNGKDLASAEKLIRETMDSKQVLEGSLEWLKSVFGSEIEFPWKRTRELVLGDDSDLWNNIFEDAFLQRMKAIIHSGFEELSRTVYIVESVRAIVERPTDARFDAGGVWFRFTEPIGKKGGPIHGSKPQVPEENDVLSCLNAYFGPEISRIRDAVDSRCKNVLEDLLCFLESPRAVARLKDLAPYTQNRCYGSMSTILKEIKSELDQLYAGLGNLNENGGSAVPPAVLVERSLFLGRLLFAFQKHSRHIPVILGSPRSWINETVSGVSLKSPSFSRYSSLAFDTHTLDSPGRKMFDSSKRQASLAASALFSIEDCSSPQLEDLTRTTQDLCIRAHNLWIQWVADELSPVLHASLRIDDALSATSPLRGWEKIIVKQEQSVEGNSEMEIYLPSVPSIYVTSFLFKACEEIHRVGGHVLDRPILQNFASRLLDKVVGVYMGFFEESHSSPVTEKGILQILLDLRFAADILSGGDISSNETPSRILKVKVPFRRKQELQQTKSAIKERLDGLMSQLSQRLDPIDWLTFEPYLWDNEKQSYLRHAVLFGLFVQLNRLYTDASKKLPTNSESNIMRCSDVPRFKYLPISGPALSSRGAVKSSSASSLDDVTSRSSWKNYMNGELSRSIDGDDNSGLGVAAPLLKSFMQVGSRFGESTLRLGSILTDGQVGRFGDMLPAQAAGLLSSITAGRTDS